MLAQFCVSKGEFVFLLPTISVIQGEDHMGSITKMNFSIDVISGSNLTKEEKNLAPRIDEMVDSKSYQVIKISAHRYIIEEEQFEKENYDDDRSVIKQADIIKAIEEYSNEVKEQQLPQLQNEINWTYSNGYNYKGIKKEDITEWIKEYGKEVKKQHIPKLQSALKYFKNTKESYIFTSHWATQYSFDDPDRTDEEHNLVITNFKSRHKSNDWNPYLIFISSIPTKYMGSAKYSLTVNGEWIYFRSSAQKKIWSFSDKYWGYAKIFSTNNGKDMAPLLIKMQHPMDSYLDNGFYLVIPK